MGIHEEYQKKRKTAEDAVKLVKNGDWVDYCQGLNFPFALDAALGNRVDELTDVKVRNGITMRPSQVVEKDPDSKAFTYVLWHCSGMDRKNVAEGRAYFSPMLFRYNGTYYKKGLAPVNVAMITVSPMDKNGNFSFGLGNCCVRDIMDAADIVIVEANAQMPKVYGLQQDHIHISEVDCVVESDIPLPTVPEAKPSVVDRKIAENIMPYLTDGMTLQLGIGGIPSAIGQLIASSDIKDIGMHTEQVNNGYLRLYESGKLTNAKKEIDVGKGVFSVCAGNEALYQFIAENLSFASAPISYVNDPHVVSQFSNFVSINSCVALDLYGQVSSETSGLKQISGTGGQLDFVTGAFECQHGMSFLTMPSTYKDKKTGTIKSRILPYFSQGDIVTVPRAQASYIVTEYGIACLHGAATWERAERLIEVAHPEVRDDLIRQAETQKIWRRSNKR